MATRTSAKKSVKKDSVKTTAAKVAAPKKPAAKTKKTAVRKVESNYNDSTEQSFAAKIPAVKLPEVLTKKPSKRIIALGATLIVVVGLLYLFGKYAIIAWVDNKPITRFQLYSMLDKRYGQDIREQLIVEQLILSEAQSKGLSVSDDEVANEIRVIEEQQGGADQLNQILQIQGISQDEFQNLIKLQILRTKIFGEGINITDEQVTQYIEENKENLPAATEGASQEDKDKLRQDVRDQLKQQEISTKFNQWLQTTLQSERIKRS